MFSTLLAHKGHVHPDTKRCKNNHGNTKYEFKNKDEYFPLLITVIVTTRVLAAKGSLGNCSLMAKGLQTHLPGTTLFPGVLVRVSSSLSSSIKPWEQN